MHVVPLVLASPKRNERAALAGAFVTIAMMGAWVMALTLRALILEQMLAPVIVVVTRQMAVGPRPLMRSLFARVTVALLWRTLLVAGMAAFLAPLR